jgi:hypothetical protein
MSKDSNAYKKGERAVAAGDISSSVASDSPTRYSAQFLHKFNQNRNHDSTSPPIYHMGVTNKELFP